jgi:hypothetical protein
MRFEIKKKPGIPRCKFSAHVQLHLSIDFDIVFRKKVQKVQNPTNRSVTGPIGGCRLDACRQHPRSMMVAVFERVPLADPPQTVTIECCPDCQPDKFPLPSTVSTQIINK